ncbi:MAG: 4'-phosphopantetheinyl transferase superfamily protein [Chloroflexi bacterium]|nr:4'-phosphopantetheinyl transferase superfamily protein [Chloroflexota bacterium]
MSEPWELPTSKFPETTAFQSLKLKNAIKVQVSFWLRVWSRLILTDNEFQEFNQLRTPEFKRVEWINSRLVAKDAVRAWLKQQHGIEMCPADIEIAHDEHGKPIPQGVWIDEIGVPPALSVAHTDGLAIAIVGRSSGQYGVGIDIERIRSQPEGFEETAFLPEERALLDSLEGDNRDQWVMRFWCAKEAMVKAIGRGAIEGPHGISVARVDFHTGTVWVTLRGKLAAEFPEFAANGAVVYTAEEDGYAVASTLCEKELRS